MWGRTPAAAVAVASAALLLAVASPASAASGDVAIWQMGDSGSTMKDSSGHGHNGTLHGVTVQQPGFSGSGFGFFGNPSYVTVPTSSDLNPGTADFSITVHAKFSKRPAGDYDLLRKGLGTDSGDYKVEILSGGNAFCYFKGTSGAGSVSRGANLADNRWHTITCSRTAAKVTVTVDGSSTAKSARTGTISNSAALTIGAKGSSGGDQYRGLLDAVRVHKG